jgi:hypothetical protein
MAFGLAGVCHPEAKGRRSKSTINPTRMKTPAGCFASIYRLDAQASARQRV